MSKVCNYCGKKGKEVGVECNCRKIYYCSKGHQTKDLRNHKGKCNKLGIIEYNLRSPILNLTSDPISQILTHIYIEDVINLSRTCSKLRNVIQTLFSNETVALRLYQILIENKKEYERYFTVNNKWFKASSIR